MHMTRLVLAMGVLLATLSPVYAGSGKAKWQHDGKAAQSKLDRKDSRYVGGGSKSIRNFMSTSHPRLSDAALRQLYISKGFGR